MFCPQCGTKASGESNFCRSCGTNMRLVGLALTYRSVGGEDAELARRFATQQEIIAQQASLQRRRARLTGGIITSCVGLAMMVVLTLAGESEGPWLGIFTLLVGAGLILSGLFARTSKRPDQGLLSERSPSGHEPGGQRLSVRDSSNISVRSDRSLETKRRSRP